MINEKYIKTLVKEKLENSDKFLVDISISTSNKIFVFLDSDSNLTIDDCVKVSRYIESNLDREEQDFELHVSSAGLTEPFKITRQYKKNIGKEITVTLKDGIVIKGVLSNLNNKSITLQKSIKSKAIKEVEISFDDIKQAKCVISFKR